jgi:ornithine--oxo-acid transaminase
LKDGLSWVTANLEVRFGARNNAPVTIVRGEGVYVWDESGRRYTDMMGAYSAVSFGHCHPRLVGSLTLQAQRPDAISGAFARDASTKGWWCAQLPLAFGRVITGGNDQ